MADVFEIKVPITVKGGREGDKVGKQIGSKIAEQIKKSFRSIGVGGANGGDGTVSGIGGVTKGLKGVATKLGVIAAIGAVAVGLLRKSSPYLKGVLSIFGRAFTIFFRPFGDFLATLLRPLAIWLMKMAVAFLKWTRGSAGAKAGVGAATGAAGGAIVGGIVGSVVPGIGTAVGAGIGALIGGTISLIKSVNWEELGETIKNFGSWIFDKLKGVWNYAYDFGGWFWKKLIGIWDWAYDFGNWFWTKLKSVWNYAQDFNSWLWDKLKGIWSWSWNFGNWFWTKLKSVWNFFEDFGGWLWIKLTGIWNWSYNLGKWLWDKITNTILDISPLGSLKKIIGYQMGTPFVPETGLYKLHRGEQVVPRGQSEKTVIFRPTFNVTSQGMRQDIDADALARRFGRVMEMDLKQRGII